MELIALLLALAVLHYQQIPTGLQRDAWYYDWYDSLTYLPEGLPRLLVALALPVVGLDLLLRFVNGWVFGLLSLLIAVGVLLYSFGRGDLGDQIAGLADDAEREDTQGIYHRVEALLSRTGTSELDAEDSAALGSQAIRSLSYRFLEHVFAVVFWFFVLGPAAALLYRLLWLAANDQVSDGQNPEDQDAEGGTVSEVKGSVGLARSALYWSEWLPVRALGLILAIVGNFSACVESWLESLVSAESSSSLLGVFVSTSFAPQLTSDTARGDGDGGSDLAARVRSLEPLFFRCILAWLVFVAVITVSL